MERKDRAPKCPYCGMPTEKATGKLIYPHRRDLQDMHYWLCNPCDAYVGCHRGTWKPFGRIANSELRRAKVAAHNAFDPLWKTGRMSRSQCYRWLAEQLGISKSQCHIGLFDVAMCVRVVNACQAYGGLQRGEA